MLRGLANGLRVSQALFVAAHLGIADHLSQGALDRHDLARATGTDAAALGRLMRALCSLGLFAESPVGHFSLRPLGQFLRTAVPGSYRSGVLMHAGPTRWRCWSGLLETVRTGTAASERLLGKPIFDFYAGDAEESKIHDEAMRAASASHAQVLLDAIDFPSAGVVVDVGGGTGELLAAILTAHRDLRAVLFDVPDVVGRATQVLGAAADRCAIESGSFFERVPAAGDTYLLKHILHDWDDERANAILQCCRRFMPAHARLVIIERKLPDLAEPGSDIEGFVTDLEMLVMTAGRERTEAELRRMLADAGFELLRVVPTTSPLSLFEARPAMHVTQPAPSTSAARARSRDLQDRA
jgi:hypothetical protein